MRTIAATKFKATCLAVLDEVARTGEPVLICKRGRPVAQLAPPLPEGARYAQEKLLGSVVIEGDVIEPVLPAAAWEVESHRAT
jgi:prevent-host-death family protein